jgi:exodeoxyribonuclease-3
VAILRRGADPIERRRGLPGDPTDLHSRYIEAEIGDLVIGGLYLPNGNPAPGPKFDYKLGWLKRFEAHARSLLDEKRPVVLAGDYNIIPTDLDVYVPDRWRDDALFRPEVRAAYERLLGKAGSTPCAPSIRARRSTLSGTIYVAGSIATPACASTTCC